MALRVDLMTQASRSWRTTTLIAGLPHLDLGDLDLNRADDAIDRVREGTVIVPGETRSPQPRRRGHHRQSRCQ